MLTSFQDVYFGYIFWDGSFMWYGAMCAHLYDLLDVLAAKATATTAAAKATATATTEVRTTAGSNNKNRAQSTITWAFCLLLPL